MALVIFVSSESFSRSSNTGKLFVTISADNEVKERYPLNVNRRIVLNEKYGNNTIVIEDGEVFMEEANCPDKYCVGTGHINRVGEQIICLPNRVCILIESDYEEGEFDAYSY